MMQQATLTIPRQSTRTLRSPGMRAVRMVLGVLLVLVICHFSTQIGFAHKFPPHYISPLWPTGAILFSVLLIAPVRHWWVYVLAAYATSIVNDVRAGFPVSAVLFILAGVLEILIAALGVRRFANGTRSFDNLRSLVAYLAIAVLMAPGASALIAAFAGASGDYWFYWRVWFLSEALAFLMLAPAIISWIGARRPALSQLSLRDWAEACLVGGVLLAITVRVFDWPMAEDIRVPALVYLPLPVLLWAAVRFGPRGVASSLLVVACLSISGAVHGRGPFASDTPPENVLALQLFLIAMSVPLLFLATLIEEGRQRTSALSESEARFRSMADTAPVMIWMAGTDNRCTYFNQRWLVFTGRSMAHELGHGWTEGIHADDRQRCLSTVAAAFVARAPFEMEYRLRHHGGEYRWILNHGAPRSSLDGAFAGYIGSCLDISERKRAELQLQEQRKELTHLSRVAMLGEFTGALAHELNQPLTAILANAQAAQRFLAASEPDLNEVREILGEIVEDDNRAGEVIRRLRDLFRKGEMASEPLDVAALIADVARFVHSDAVVRHVILDIRVCADLPPIRGDKIQLQQVMLNLLLNAFEVLHHAPKDDRRVVVEVRKSPGRTIQVSVRDNGPGLTGDAVDRVFEPFFTTKQSGMGMGLAISRSIVEAHGGLLRAENNLDGGANFSFTLPIEEARGDEREVKA